MAVGMVQAGGVELDELHVGDHGPGPVGHGHPVAGGDVGIAGVEVDLADPAGGQQGDAGQEGVHLAGGFIEDIGPQAGFVGFGHHPALAHHPFQGDEIDAHVVFEDPDTGVGQDLLRQDALHFGAGHVLGVDDPAPGVAAFPAEVVAVVFAGIEVGPQGDQFPDPLRPLAHHQFDDVRVRQALPHGEGVLDVIFKPVIRTEHCGNATLGLAGGGLGQAPLGYQIDLGKIRHLQGITETRQPEPITSTSEICSKIGSFARKLSALSSQLSAKSQVGKSVPKMILYRLAGKGV